jgi:hypothetical protein
MTKIQVMVRKYHISTLFKNEFEYVLANRNNTYRFRNREYPINERLKVVC